MKAHLNEFISQLAAAAQHQARMPVPNIVLAAGHGAGVSTQLQAITQRICALELLIPSGEETYLEWSLGEGEKGMDQLLMRVRTATGFYARFRGFIALDLRELLSSRSFIPPLDRLQAFVRDSYGRIIFYFIVPEDLPQDMEQRLLSLLCQPAPASAFILPMPEKDKACICVARRLQKAGYTLDEKAALRLSEAVEKLKKGRQYEGYNTLNNLADAILWMKSIQPHHASVTEEEILPILRQYLQSGPAGEERHQRRIGFACDERRYA